MSSQFAFIDIIDFAVRLEALRTTEAIWEEFRSLAHGYGFGFCGYMDLPGPGERLQDAFICNSLPLAWYEHYGRNNYVVNDPLVLHLLRTSRPYTREDVVACPAYTAEQRRILDEGVEFGIKAIFNVPLRSPRNAPALIGLVGENSALAPRERAALHLAAIAIDLRLRSPIPHSESPFQPLTDRERQCLQWVAVGKSDREIADILKISEKTVNFHIESVKRKYGVYSRSSAAAIAARLGVVHV